MFGYSGILKEMKSDMFLFVAFGMVLIFASLAAANNFSEWETTINAESVDGRSELDLNDCRIKLIFVHVYEDSPLLKTEKAAWITMNSKREFGFVDWPNRPQNRIQIWHDVLPDNIIAIAHTHPNHIDPKPSTQDRLVAQQRDVPVYTLTRKTIWSVTPDGKITQHINRPWLKNYKDECGQD